MNELERANEGHCRLSKDVGVRFFDDASCLAVGDGDEMKKWWERCAWETYSAARFANRRVNLPEVEFTCKARGSTLTFHKRCPATKVPEVKCSKWWSSFISNVEEWPSLSGTAYVVRCTCGSTLAELSFLHCSGCLFQSSVRNDLRL